MLLRYLPISKNVDEGFPYQVRHGLEKELVEPSGDSSGSRCLGGVEEIYEISYLSLCQRLDEIGGLFFRNLWNFNNVLSYMYIWPSQDLS